MFFCTIDRSACGGDDNQQNLPICPANCWWWHRLGAQFLGSYGIKSLAGLGLYGTVTCLILLAAGIILVVTIAILQREREFIRPMGARM